MELSELKEQILKEFDNIKDEVIQIGDDIFSHPELGFKEFRTSKIVKEFFEKHGITYEDGLALTGVKGEIKFSEDGPNVAIFGELDAVVSPEHPHRDPHTNAAHACGHNSQIANLLAAAAILNNPIFKKHLKGKVTLFAVPAEEYVEIGYRLKLREEGKIKYPGGKQEFIRLGLLDDVDIAMMNHAKDNTPERIVGVGGTSNGFVGKRVVFWGREAHAGDAPEKGINALNAAQVALNALNSIRETLKDENHIRIHPIITKGGDLVNIIPREVIIESYVRGAGIEAIEDASSKFDWAMAGGAISIGAEVEIENIPGYMPLYNEEKLTELFRKNAISLVGEKNVFEIGHFSASTDMGDVSGIKPSIHPVGGGYRGSAHTKDFEIVDKEMAYIVPAKLYVLTIIDLLSNNAKEAEKIIKNWKPKISKEDYLKTLDSFFEKKVAKRSDCIFGR